MVRGAAALAAAALVAVVAVCVAGAAAAEEQDEQLSIEAMSAELPRVVSDFDPVAYSNSNKANVTEIYLEHEGRNRSFVLFTPTSYTGASPMPLVVTVHFWLAQPEIMQVFTYMNEVAEEKGFITVYPRGIFRSFNAGPVCCGPEGRDDVLFIRKIVAETQLLRSIDSSRVYATGMSNGGYMSHRLACDASDLFVAIAPVAGASPWPTDQFPTNCKPTRPMPILALHGTEDFLVPYVTMVETVGHWLNFNGCDGTATAPTYSNGDTSCVSYVDGCAPQDNGQRTNVTVCTTQGNRHWYWPHSPITINDDIDTSREIWRFFSQYSF